jgi:hypothetical protein
VRVSVYTNINTIISCKINQKGVLNKMNFASKILFSFLRAFNKLFSINKQALQSRIDLYIASKSPTSHADIERILKEYERLVNKGGLYS